jgi:DNA polymerase elongation subunit (family B)
MKRVVFDIETLAFPFETFDDVQQEYLLKFADTEEKREQALLQLNLYAPTAGIIAIGMLNPETNAGKVFYQSDVKEEFTSDDGKVGFISGSEKELLEWFWSAIKHYDQFITFNGRTFDCPFVMLRSAIVGVAPTRNLVPYRYDASTHCDLLDQLSFYSAVKKFNLDFYCKVFGIKSPKSEGITGLDLGDLFREKRFREIARYCVGDVQAEAELFNIWNKYLNIKD